MTVPHPEFPVLLYDGGCGFCSAIVRFILERDRLGALRFASLNSRFAASVIAAHPELSGTDSAVWVEPRSARVHDRSAATLQVARYLGGVWRLATIGWLVPRPLRDWAYDLVAHNRRRIAVNFARPFEPSPGMRDRFLDD